MKHLILSIAIITGITGVSCQKEKGAEPAVPATAKTIQVEYRISSQSGQLNATYLFPDASGELKAVKELVSRTYHVIQFSYASGSFFSVEAVNATPAYKTVQVEIYIDGVLKNTGISTSPSQKAIAQGNY